MQGTDRKEYYHVRRFTLQILWANVFQNICIKYFIPGVLSHDNANSDDQNIEEP